MVPFLMFLSGVFMTFITETVSTSDYNQEQSRVINEVTSDWPSLQFQFKLKRSSMRPYRHSEFSMFANPVISADESSILYDIFASFNDGTVTSNYTLVNGVAYLQISPLQVDSNTPLSVQYLRSELSDILPINSIVSALNEATPVSNFSGISIDCNDGKIYKVSVSAFNFALCALWNTGFTMYGSNLDIKVEYLDRHVNIVAPKLSDDGGDKSAVELSPIPVSPIGKELLTGKKVVLGNRKLSEAVEFSLDEEMKCSCKSTQRPCIFVHGLGVKGETSHNQKSLPYWGNITNHAPCCSSIKYAHLDTVKHSWMEAVQQQKVCDRILAVSKSSTNVTIRDTILVTHSMGSLILAGAIAHQRCKLHSSSTWISTAAPLIGSMGSDYAQQICIGHTNIVVETVAEFEHQCPVNAATKSLAYQNGSYSSPRLNEAYKVVQEVYRKHVFAVMCSESYSGILTPYQANFWVLAHFIPHKSKKNDGTVEFQSCAMGLPLSQFGNTYKSRFYRTKLNHYDMQFKGGDAFLNQAKMPVKWFECLL